MLLKKQMGMTLIEVLIAAIILFMAIGLVSSAFQQSIMLQQKVVTQQEKMRLLQWIKPIIEFQLSVGQLKGAESWGGMKASWSAELLEKKRFVDSISDDSGYIAGRGYVVLYEVSLSLAEQEPYKFNYTVWSSQ